ncbi:MAG: SulP family inorganic anion transporter [Ilumatobacteraceae bacterium]
MHDTRRWFRLPPLFEWIRGYERQWLVADCITGLLIVTIAIPLSIGMAEVAGVDPVVGLYTCVFPLIAYAAFGSSRHLVLGLDASTAAMVAAAVAPLAVGDSSRYLTLANLLALLAGIVCLLAGFLRFGSLATLLSPAALLGYQAGLALTVIVNQLPRLLRVPSSGGGTIERVTSLLRSIDDVQGYSLLIGGGILIALFVARSWHPHVPAAFALLIVAALVVNRGWLGEGIQLIGEIPSGSPPLGWPTFTASDLADLAPAALAIALVASADTLASSEAFAARNNYQVDPNRELAGLGAANVVSGLTGGIAASASAARTAVAESTGAHTPLASIAAALALLALLTTFTRPLELIPIAALAAVVIAAISRLVDIKAFVLLWRQQRAEFLVAVAVAIMVVLVGILVAIALALAIPLARWLIERSRRSS